MIKALISPNEPRETGYRVAGTDPVGFPIAQPLFWADCSDDVVADQYWYDPADQTVKIIPIMDPNQEQPESEGTQEV